MIANLKYVEEDQVRIIKDINKILIKDEKDEENTLTDMSVSIEKQGILVDMDTISIEKLNKVDFLKVTDLSNHTLPMLINNLILYKDFKNIRSRTGVSRFYELYFIN